MFYNMNSFKMFDYFNDLYINHIFGFTYVFTEVFFCVVIGLMFSDTKKLNKKTILFALTDIVCVWFVLLLVESALYCISKYTDALNWRYVRFYLWPMICLAHVFVPYDRNKLKFRLVYAVLLATFINSMLSISGPLGSIVRNTFGLTNSIISDVTFFSVLFLSGAVLVYLKSLSLNNYKYIKALYILILIIVYGLSYALLTIVAIASSESEIIYPIEEFLIFAIDLLVYLIFHLSVRENERAKMQEAKNLLLESELSQVELLEDKLEEMHKIRHEMKNLFSLMNVLIQEKKYDEMEKMFADLNEKTMITLNFADTGNRVVDAILNVALTKAYKTNIKIIYKAAVPAEVNLPKEDLYCICLNALDNAMESLVREGLNEPIYFTIRKDGNFLFVGCQNAVDKSKMSDKERLKLRTAKKERNKHGYGTKIIKQRVEDLRGALKYSLENDQFSIDIMLPLDEGEDAK